MNARRALALAVALAGAACIGQAAWIHAKAALAQVLIARAWAARERGATEARPWPWADTTPVARLVVAGRTERAFYVLEGASGRNLAFGPAHDPASVLPGERGNSVLSGHRDTSFRFLATLAVGDRLRVERNGAASWFIVTDARVVDSRTQRIALGSEVPQLTLVTCYPFEALVPGGPLRWVVTARSAQLPAGRPPPADAL